MGFHRKDMLHRHPVVYLSFIALIVIAFSLGCLGKPKPYADIEYRVSIWTDENATLYLPLPLDLPNYTVSDIVSMLKVKEKSPDTQVSYYITDTIYGKALRIHTNGNVVLHSKAGYEYLETHPDVPVHPFIPGQNEPMFFDLSLQVNQTDMLNYERWAYLEKENGKFAEVKFFEYLDITTDPGVEGWLSLEENSPYYGNFTLKPGWQIIKFRHTIGYH